MRKVMLLCKNILKLSFKKKGNLVTFLLLPILGVFAALAFNNDNTAHTKIGIYSENNSYIAIDMVKAIGENDNFEVYELKDKNYEILLKDKKLDCVLIIDKNFDKQIIGQDIEKINLISQQGQEITAWIENYVNFYVDNLMGISKVAQGNSEKFKELYNEYKKENLKLEDLSVQDKTKSKAATKQSIGFLLVFMLMASRVTTDSILNDKYRRTFFRIFCAPVSKIQYIAANIIANMIVFLIQVMIILFISINILKLNFYINTLTLLLLFMIFGMVAIGFGVVIAAFSKTTAQASQLQNIVIVPTSMLAGCFWPLEVMPNFFQKFSVIFPQTWVLRAIDELQYGKSIIDIKIQLLVILLFALILFIVGANRIRRDDDIKNVI